MRLLRRLSWISLGQRAQHEMISASSSVEDLRSSAMEIGLHQSLEMPAWLASSTAACWKQQARGHVDCHLLAYGGGTPSHHTRLPLAACLCWPWWPMVESCCHKVPWQPKHGAAAAGGGSLAAQRPRGRRHRARPSHDDSSPHHRAPALALPRCQPEPALRLPN